MTVRLLKGLVLSLGLMTFTSCSTKYQELLNDRDAQIRELNSRLSEARSGQSDAERQAQEAKDALSKERTKPVAEATTPKAGNSELDGLRKDLPETEIRYSRGRVSIGIDNSITFDSGSDKIKPGGEKLLHRVADVLKSRYPNRRIYVEGHTDTDPIHKTKGKFEDNVDLSVERAKAVRGFLVKGCSVPERSIAVVGYGEHDPRESGKGDSSKAKNRRVEIVVGEAF